MIWGYSHFRKPPCDLAFWFSSERWMQWIDPWHSWQPHASASGEVLGLEDLERICKPTPQWDPVTRMDPVTAETQGPWNARDSRLVRFMHIMIGLVLIWWSVPAILIYSIYIYSIFFFYSSTKQSSHDYSTRILTTCMYEHGVFLQS